MKKLYTVLVALLIAATANAQVIKMDASNMQNHQLPGKGILKANHRNAPAEGWIFYQDYLESYFGTECESSQYALLLKNDSLGLYGYSDGYGHIHTYSVSQTYDLESSFFDYASMSGDLSLVGTTSLNVDSFCVVSMYLRDENMPASVYDTLVVGFVADDDLTVYHYNSYPESSCFINLDFDPATGVQQNAQIFKLPLGPDDVAEPSETPGSYYLKEYLIPANITNVTAKKWNIAYTFKSGMNYAMNDTIHSSFRVYFYLSNDNDGYSPESQNPNICDNMSHGGIVMTFSNGDVDYFYPMFWFDDINYVSYLGMKVSCTDCAIVNVPELEKNNPTVYPNPATNNFTVDLGNDEKADIQLFNIVGQMVYSETITGTAQVNVANLHSGVYMLKVNQNGKTYTTKVVVK